jgi:hypothetical protein
VTPGSSKPQRPVPVERGRALGVLGGLTAFVVGFAVAGAMVMLDRGRTPPYVVGICLGLVGMGLVGYFYQRGTAELPQARLWSPVLLRAVIAPLGLPVVPVIAVLYVLGAVGIVGNLLIPLSARR